MKIVILDAYAANPGDLSWDEFAALGELTVYDRTAQEDAAARIGDAEVVFINKVRLTDEIFAACPNLKLVSILATGYNIVDLAAAKRRGITVCNVPGYSTRAVVQMTFALLLEICQQVGLHSGAVHTGRWQTCPDFCFWDRPLIELDGKTMGIVGYGAIGSAVGTVAQALGMKLLVTARHERPVPEGARFVSLPELLAQSDVVSLHCPQTAENARMIDAGALEGWGDPAQYRPRRAAGRAGRGRRAAQRQAAGRRYGRRLCGADPRGQPPADRAELLPHAAYRVGSA